jgi:hypothetical protein
VKSHISMYARNGEIISPTRSVIEV